MLRCDGFTAAVLTGASGTRAEARFEGGDTDGRPTAFGGGGVVVVAGALAIGVELEVGVDVSAPASLGFEAAVVSAADVNPAGSVETAFASAFAISAAVAAAVSVEAAVVGAGAAVVVAATGGATLSTSDVERTIAKRPAPTTVLTRATQKSPRARFGRREASG